MPSKIACGVFAAELEPRLVRISTTNATIKENNDRVVTKESILIPFVDQREKMIKRNSGSINGRMGIVSAVAGTGESFINIELVSFSLTLLALAPSRLSNQRWTKEVPDSHGSYCAESDWALTLDEVCDNVDPAKISGTHGV